MQLIDPNHPFYQPLWVRVVIVAACAGWFGIEMLAHQPFWATIAAGVAAYSAFALLLNFKPDPPKPAEPMVVDDGDDDSDVVSNSDQTKP